MSTTSGSTTRRHASGAPVRKYRDLDGVVHEASDLGMGNNITLCEREASADWYDTRELRVVDADTATTCLLCLVAPEWRRKMTNP